MEAIMSALRVFVLATQAVVLACSGPSAGPGAATDHRSAASQPVRLHAAVVGAQVGHAMAVWPSTTS